MPGATGDGVLVVDMAGKSQVVLRSDVLTFGRSAELVVDEANPYLHRVVGRFFWHGNCWWLENLGTFIQLEVVPQTGTATRLPARQPDDTPVLRALPGSGFRVLFESAGFSYELVGTIDTAVASEAASFNVSDLGRFPGSDATPGTVTLAAEERALLLHLAEPYMRDPLVGPAAVPSDRDLAAQLGWPVTKLNRKLDYLCSRFCKAGARGLQSARGQLAADRRWRLAEHAVKTGLVAPTDLTT